MLGRFYAKAMYMACNVDDLGALEDMLSSRSFII